MKQKQLKNFLINNSSANSFPLALRGERNYVNSSDIAGFLCRLISPNVLDFSITVDFLKPIRTQVFVGDAEALRFVDPSLVLAKAKVEAHGISSTLFVTTDDYSEGLSQIPESHGVVCSSQFHEGFTAELASRDLTGFLFDTMSCMKEHWKQYHALPAMQAVVRRLRISFPMAIPNSIEGRFRPLKRSGQEWSFRSGSGSQIHLSIHAFPIRTGSSPGSF
ncbi:MAG: hypothetical protein FGM40_01750 [Rhodocyclaceae bacterium]|nr:hypothetical protein [Rhodocyclaceae bacterium]